MLSVISWAAVYFVIWWTTLFVVLPFGARGREEIETVSGADRGAPVRAPMKRLFLMTTVLATVLFAAFYVVLTRQLIGLDDIPFLPKFEQIR